MVTIGESFLRIPETFQGELLPAGVRHKSLPLLDVVVYPTETGCLQTLQSPLVVQLF